MANKTNRSTKKKGPSAQQRKTIRAQQSKRQMWAVVLFAVGILFLALTFIKGTKVWLGVHNILFGLLGWSAYFIAPLILYVAIITAMDKPISSIRNKLWQIAVLVVMISGAIEIFTSLPPGEGFVATLKALYEKGVAKEGGGVLGYVLAGPLLALAGTPGPQIIILLAIFVFIMIITGSTLLHLVQLLRRPVEGIESAYSSRREGRIQRQEEQELLAEEQRTLAFDLPEESAPATKAGKPVTPAPKGETRFNTDIDISGDKDPDEFDHYDAVEVPELQTQETKFYDSLSMPEHPVTAESKYSFDTPEREARIEPTPKSEFIDSPVEYISVLPEEKTVPIRIPQSMNSSRPHPLEEDIRLAHEDDVSQSINRYLEGIQTDEDRAAEDSENLSPDVTEGLQNRIVGSEKGAEEDVSLPEALRQQITQTNVTQLPTRNPAVSQGSVIVAAPPEPTVPVYQYPPLDLLNHGKGRMKGDITAELKENGDRLVKTLESFGVKTKIINISRGPAVTRYELQPSAGVKISRITGLADDIALNLAAAGIRIEAPIPNKAAVGIEVPNKDVGMVPIREIMESREFRAPSPYISIALGKDITGGNTIGSIAKMPHVLIAGATGSGKSVCINAIIISILYKYPPDEVKLLMIDPKVVELGIYNGIPHLLVPVVTNAKKAAGALAWAVSEMLDRYRTFAEHTVRDLAGYNKLAEHSDELPTMPQIVIIIDELADLMMAAPNEVEDSIMRLAQMARAAGMHLVIATQRPSVDVITGVIKANVPSRIAFAVSSQVDSRTILDSGGAEKLLGRGDMLFFPVGAAKPTRIQGCFVSDAEVERVVDYIKKTEEPDYDDGIVEEIEKLTTTEPTAKDDGGGFDDRDELTPDAIELVMEAGQASISQLQRRLRVGYARAGRLIDTLEIMGVVGPHEGSKPRQVLITQNEYMEMKLMNEDALAKPAQLSFQDAEKASRSEKETAAEDPQE